MVSSNCVRGNCFMSGWFLLWECHRSPCLLCTLENCLATYELRQECVRPGKACVCVRVGCTHGVQGGSHDVGEDADATTAAAATATAGYLFACIPSNQHRHDGDWTNVFSSGGDVSVDVLPCELDFLCWHRQPFQVIKHLCEGAVIHPSLNHIPSRPSRKGFIE